MHRAIRNEKMLASDLDGTVLGDDCALRQLARWIDENRDTLSLVYVTGRFFESVAELIAAGDLPEPDAVIAAVGTSIHLYPSGEVVEEWRDRVGDRWDARTVRRVLQGQESLRLQSEELQSEFKVSYYADDADRQTLETWRRKLQFAGIDAEMIYSSRRDLDFLPIGMNKGSAVAFLAERWSIAPENILVSGNTGNDIALFEQGLAGIIVANAEPELKRLNGPHIYHARYACASGVLEGIRHMWEPK